MEEFLQQVEALNGTSPSEAIALFQNNKDLLSRATVDEVTRGLQGIDPARHTIPFVMLLDARCNKETPTNSAEKTEKLMNIAHLATDMIPQLNTEHITHICDTYTRLFAGLCTTFLSEANPKPFLPLVRNAIVALTGGRSIITSLHGQFFEMCLKARDYEIGAELIKHNVHSVMKTNTTEHDVKAVLFYFFHAGNLLCESGNYRTALQMYMSVLVIPSTACVSSAYVIDTYKKFTLINLILGSPVKELPSNLSAVLDRAIRPKCQEYDELSRICRNPIYGKNTTKTVMQYVNNKSKCFDQDEHKDLVIRVAERVKYDALMRVAQAFDVMKLEDVVKRCNLNSLKEAQELIQDLVKEERLIAEFDESSGFIKFGFPENDDISVETLEKYDGLLNALKEEVATFDDEARCNKYYVMKQGGQPGPLATPTTSTMIPSTNDDEGFGQSGLPSLGLQAFNRQ
ncbi:hypothetical protein L596_014847 [Steinernema carpocapsae]|uniref:COP9 signalosome complex subunit 3 N-terminal helical repeats domain-containing protein n=1 Tax=Steinernema carpocapsae TaxID=34508 RepID=A0A4V6A2X4_STECR|nr:hypothetical protein L596_014847 [Steinernema carpocapsae]